MCGYCCAYCIIERYNCRLMSDSITEFRQNTHCLMSSLPTVWCQYMILCFCSIKNASKRIEKGKNIEREYAYTSCLLYVISRDLLILNSNPNSILLSKQILVGRYYNLSKYISHAVWRVKDNARYIGGGLAISRHYRLMIKQFVVINRDLDLISMKDKVDFWD